MINIDNETRQLSQASIVVGYKQENKAESVEFQIPDYLKDYGKKICFKTKSGKVFSKLFDNTTSNVFTFTRTETQYGELDATIEFFKTENEDMIIYKTSMLHIIFNESIICEDEVQPDEPKIPILESLIEKVTELNNTITENEETRNNNENTRISNENERKTNEKERETYYTNIQNKVNNGEFNGATYLPNVDAEGNISWTNNKGLENPSSQNIRGPQGIQGAQGEPFKIKKTYPSIEEMQADFDNMEVGDYAMIANSVELEDNAKLYYRTETEWVFITDFSGATGIQGEQGPQGIQGIQGERGIGISKLEVINGSLWVTLTDSTTQNAGIIITDEVKQWIVNQVTDNAKSDFNTYYNGKVTDFDNHTTTKIQEYNTNATNKVNEYNQNAESLINRVVECEAENERLRNDIKSIALQGEASGENIHLEDSSDARCEIEIGGKQKQETRSGKNRINLGLLGSGTLNGVKYTYNESNQSITFDGTCTKDNTRFIINDDANIQTIAKKTTLTAQYLSGSVSNYFTARIADNEWKHNLLLSLLTLNSSNNKVSLTETADMVGVHIDIKANNGTILNNFTIQLMLTDEVDTEYEMYGASPSIEFPSPVKSVGNIKNILDMSNAKNGASAGIICTINADGSYKYKGTATSQYVNVWFMGGYATDLPTLFTLEPGTYYINDVSLFEGTTGFANDSSKKIWTFTRAYNVTGVRAPNAVSGNTYDETKYPIIAKIDHKIPWAPYDCGYEKIDIFNKNIFKEKTNKKDIKKAYNDIIGGILNIKKGEICIISFDTNNNQGGLYLNENIFSFQGNYSVTCDGKRHYLIGKAKDNINKNVTILKTNKETTNNYDISNVLVTKYDASNVDTKYIEHQEQSYLVDVQQPMFEGDTFVKQDGKWYEKHCVKTEIMLTFPTTNIEVCGTFANFQINRNIAFAVVKNDLKITNVRNDILCDKLKAKDNSVWGGKEDGIQTYINSNKFVISIPFEDIEKNFGEELTINNYSQAFRKYINDNGPFKIYYLLAEPAMLECTEAQSKVLDEIYNKAHTYKNITNISAESAEVNPIINVKYLKDTEKYIEDKITNALTEINANN